MQQNTGPSDAYSSPHRIPGNQIFALWSQGAVLALGPSCCPTQAQLLAFVFDESPETPTGLAYTGFLRAYRAGEDGLLDRAVAGNRVALEAWRSSRSGRKRKAAT